MGKKDNLIHFYDGCRNPYPVSEDWMPKGYNYDVKEDAINMMTHLNPDLVKGGGNVSGIKWEVVEDSIFTALKVDWCKNYIKTHG